MRLLWRRSQDRALPEVFSGCGPVAHPYPSLLASAHVSNGPKLPDSGKKLARAGAPSKSPDSGNGTKQLRISRLSPEGLVQGLDIAEFFYRHLLIPFVGETEPLFQYLCIGTVFEADGVLLHVIQRSWRNDRNGDVVERYTFRFQVEKLECVAKSRQNVYLKGAVRRNVLDSGIVAQKILRGDALDFRIINDSVQRCSEPLDIAGFGLYENVHILCEAREPMQVKRYSTENSVPHSLFFEGREQVFDDIKIHCRTYPRNVVGRRRSLLQLDGLGT